MATATAPKVCIAILNWNNYDQTLACLESLATLDYPDYRIIVIDNASVDRSVERIRETYPDITMICSETNLGYAGGNELALQQALADGETELFWILNNDSTVLPDTLSQLVSAYQRFGEALYGGVPISSDGTSNQREWEAGLRGREPEIARVLYGSTFMIPLSIVRRYGFMDTTFFMYAEENDYCLRLRKLGVKSILVPTSITFHVSKGSYRLEPSVSGIIRYYRTRNRLIMLWRHSTRWSYVKRILKVLYFAANAGVLALRGVPGKGAECRYILLGLYDGLLRRTGKRFAPEDYLGIPEKVKPQEAP